jgi:hypothetical protein
MEGKEKVERPLQAAIVFDSALIDGEKKYSPPRDSTNGWMVATSDAFAGLRPLSGCDWALPFAPMIGSRPGVSLLRGGKLHSGVRRCMAVRKQIH